MSRRWLAARQDVLDLRRPQITREEFDSVCARRNVNDDETDTLISFLHDLGHLVYYGEDESLHEIVVCQPEWLTKAISYVLEDPLTKENGEVLDHSRLHTIWYDHGDPTRGRYEVEYHPYFLRLMEKFDISYRIPDESRSLVGQLVPHPRPSVPWESNSGLRNGQRELALRCVMEEDPPGLIPWLTVRNHRFSTGQHWRRGIFLSHQSSEALVELDRDLSINVRGASPDYFFHLLRDSLEYLIQLRWPGLEYEFEVPCLMPSKGGRRCGGRFKFESLLTAREEGRATIQCHGCFQERDVTELLTGFKPPVEAVQAKLDQVITLQQKTLRAQSDMAGTQEAVADQIRQILGALSSETKDCPRLFVLASTRVRFLGIGKNEYKLQLFCEEPERQHPVEGGEYTFEVPRDWLIKIAPYATLVAKVLSLAVPLASPLLRMADGQVVMESIKAHLDLMEKLTSELLKGKFAYGSDLLGQREAQRIMGRTGLTEAQGAGLRQFQLLLEQLDKTRRWGGLRRVLTASKDYLWVCPKHYREYDPGLPILPQPTRQDAPPL